MRFITIAAFAGAALLATLVAQTDDKDSIARGRAVYVTKCAACHGADAKGGMTSLGARGKEEVAVPDLTTIESRDGRFDALHLARHIGGKDRGWWDPCTTGMACWEHILSEQQSAAVGRLQVYNVVNFLRSIQQPAAK